jgi:hypothetical protein
MSLTCVNAHHGFRRLRWPRLEDQLNNAGDYAEGQGDNPANSGKSAAQDATASRA